MSRVVKLPAITNELALMEHYAIQRVVHEIVADIPQMDGGDITITARPMNGVTGGDRVALTDDFIVQCTSAKYGSQWEYRVAVDVSGNTLIKTEGDYEDNQYPNLNLLDFERDDHLCYAVHGRSRRNQNHMEGKG